MSSTHPDEQNRRRFQRILFNAPATLIEAGVRHPCAIIDISLNGALISPPDGWNGAAGEAVQLEIKLAEDGATILLQGEIAHVENGRAGIQRHQIDIDSISHLRRLAELNLGDARLVERELAALG